MQAVLAGMNAVWSLEQSEPLDRKQVEARYICYLLFAICYSISIQDEAAGYR